MKESKQLTDNVEIESDLVTEKTNSIITKINKLFNKIWYENIYYYIWRNPKRIIYNFWHFAKVIYNFRTFDYSYNFEIFLKSLELTANGIDDRKFILSHKETADSIRNFCTLYKRYVDDNYLQMSGFEWDRYEFTFIPIEGKEKMSRMVSVTSYTDEEVKEFDRKADELRKKDFNEMIEEFKNFQQWWD